MSEASVDSSLDSKQTTLTSSTDDLIVKLESAEDDPKLRSASADGGLETNNNGAAADELLLLGGPTLRSKTKARSSDGSDDLCSVKSETEVVVKRPAQLRAAMLGAQAAKGRRSSLNIDMRRSSLYGVGGEVKSEPGKSQIDEMIDKIKLTIAKTIESKIFSQEGLSYGKNFVDLPVKVEEIVAPVSAQVIKPKIEEDGDEKKPEVSKSRGQCFYFAVFFVGVLDMVCDIYCCFTLFSG